MYWDLLVGGSFGAERSLEVGYLVIWIANDSCVVYSTLVYLEGDASMRSYEDADGKKHSNLNIVQRTSHEFLTWQLPSQIKMAMCKKNSNS